MPLLRTPLAGYSVKFSPFDPSRLALASSQNFGIIGNGKMSVLMEDGMGSGLRVVSEFDTRDGAYDVAWSEASDAVLAVACGDGSVKLYDVTAPPGAPPLASFTEHAREASCVSWSCARTSSLLSASWDGTVRLWDAAAPGPVAVFAGHGYCVYSAAWSPRVPDVFCSASGDCTVKVWDARTGARTGPSLSLAAHAHEVLTADWSKYNDHLLATGSVDRTIKLWDVRNPSREITVLHGHGYAVRRVSFSPHAEALLLSASYDMTVRLWDAAAPGDPAARTWTHHTEFAVGCDLSSLVEGRAASAGWDGLVATWPLNGGP